MARTDNLTNFLTDVATAIKTKKGDSTPIPASNFDTEITNLPSGGGLDWSAIGYNEMPESIIDDYNYSKEIYDNWDSSVSSRYRAFYQNTKLRIAPLVDTSNVRDMSEMFRGCSSLAEAPNFSCSNITSCSSMFQNCSNLISVKMQSIGNNAYKMFAYCYELKDLNVKNAGYVTSKTSLQSFVQSCLKLTDESLDNILQMCISAINYNGTKTLAYLGIEDTNVYPVSRIEALPHYQDFIDAGWTIGY